MATRPLDGLRRSATWRTILALLVVVIIVNAGIFPVVAQRMAEYAGVSVRPMDLRLSYSAEQAYTILLSLGDSGRRLYAIVEATVDVIYPVVYTLFLFLLIERLLTDAPRPRWLDLATLVPFVAMVFDWLENAAILAMIGRFPRPPGSIATIASAFTTIKWLAGLLTLALLLYAAIRRLFRGRATAATSP